MFCFLISLVCFYNEWIFSFPYWLISLSSYFWLLASASRSSAILQVTNTLIILFPYIAQSFQG